jgi:hypothetical protein
MRPGYILIILACLLPLCSCPLSFDDLEVIEWEVVEVAQISTANPKKIVVIFHPTRELHGDEQRYYHDFECTRHLDTHKLVRLNDHPLPGGGGGFTVGGSGFYIYSQNDVKTGDKFTFDPSLFFVLDIKYASFSRTPKYKVRIVTESITFKEDE